MSVLLISKKYGELLLEVVTRARQTQMVPQSVPITYAGRLDPAATGLMLLLTDTDVHRKEEFLKLNKTYQLQILLGISTDTGDLLGKPTKTMEYNDRGFADTLSVIKQKFVKTFNQTYPIYSSKTVGGIPLWKHARNGNQIIDQSHTVTIKNIDLLKINKISSTDVHAQVTHLCNCISGDFRQSEISTIWQKTTIPETCTLVTISVSCSTGTYMRQLAMDIGTVLDIPACAFNIKRTHIGMWGIDLLQNKEVFLINHQHGTVSRQKQP